MHSTFQGKNLGIDLGLRDRMYLYFGSFSHIYKAILPFKDSVAESAFKYTNLPGKVDA